MTKRKSEYSIRNSVEDCNHHDVGSHVRIKIPHIQSKDPTRIASYYIQPYGNIPSSVSKCDLPSFDTEVAVKEALNGKCQPTKR